MKGEGPVRRTAAAERHRPGAGRTVGEETSRTGLGTLPPLSDFAVEHLLLLPLGVLVALVWVNTGPESYFQFSSASRFIVNDILMVFFFGLIAKEVVESTAPGGVLHPWRRGLLPAVAATGAVAAPAFFQVGFANALDEPMLSRAWPIPGAVDIAVAYLCARLIFGRHPAVQFILLLSIAANALSFAALAVFYPATTPDLLVSGVLMAAAVGLSKTFKRLGVLSFWPYVLAGGTLSWLALSYAGVHPAIALLPILPFVPHATRDPGFFVDALPGARDPLSKFERWSTYPNLAAVFLFGLVNGGVPLRGLENGTLVVPLAALVGKPVGVLAATGVAVAAGLHLTQRVGWRELVVIGIVAGAGFSMSLFFAAVSMAPGILLRETRMGALLTAAVVPLALLAGRLLRVGRRF
jgi:NhaA family Na+:H+ antiporter